MATLAFRPTKAQASSPPKIPAPPVTTTVLPEKSYILLNSSRFILPSFYSPLNQYWAVGYVPVFQKHLRLARLTNLFLPGNVGCVPKFGEARGSFTPRTPPISRIWDTPGNVINQMGTSVCQNDAADIRNRSLHYHARFRKMVLGRLDGSARSQT